MLKLGGLMLGVLDRFKRKKEEKTFEKKPEKMITELEQLCGSDKETYGALIDTMFLDPTKVQMSMKDAAEDAKKAEKAKDFVKARVMYEVAGGLAIYGGDVDKVVQFFSECERLLPDKKYSILKNPEKAVAVAQEFYKKHLKA
jgi:hypothetical protein